MCPHAPPSATLDIAAHAAPSAVAAPGFGSPAPERCARHRPDSNTPRRACRHMNEQPDRYGSGPLHTFSIGIEGSPDLAAAQKVADLIGTVHHGFTFTVQDGLDALFDVIWHIESYEQIRASVPMYLLSRKIKAMGYKVRRRPLPAVPAADH